MWEINKFVRVTEDCKEAYPQGRGRTLAAAIRDVGIRCETCKTPCIITHKEDINFFCAHHSELMEDK